MDFEDAIPVTATAPVVQAAAVAAPAPLTVTDPLYVVVPGEDGGRVKTGPCQWQPIPGSLPAVGDRCVLVQAADADRLTAWVAVFDGRDVPIPPIPTAWITGELKMTAAAITAGAEPAGWLLCDGRSVLRGDYPDLFTALGGVASPHGLPDGTHFNLPDFRGRSPLGVGLGDASGATSRALGTKYGKQTHLLTSAESGVPAHTHPPSAGTTFLVARAGSSALGAGATVNADATTGANTAANAAQAHENQSPALAVNFLIKT